MLLFEEDLGVDADADPILVAHGPAAREEAARKLITNHERVLADLTNPSREKNIEGKPLTQAFTMQRVATQDMAHADAFLYEVARRLLGRRASGPEGVPDPMDPRASAAWIAASKYLDLRIQSTPQQKQGRTPDMSEAAAAAMKAVMKDLAKRARSSLTQAQGTANGKANEEGVQHFES